MFIPSQLIIGDSSRWNDFPTKDNLGNVISSADWSLFYILNGVSKKTLTSTVSGSGWLTSITALETAALVAGDYFWQAYVIKGDERITLDSGKISLVKNLSLADAGFDARSQIKKDLDNVRIAIRAMVSNGAVQEYKINNRELKKMSIGELRSYESQLKYELSQEERAQRIQKGLGDPHSLKVRF